MDIPMYQLDDTFLNLSNEVEMGVSSGVVENACSKNADVITREELIKQQKCDPDLLRTAERAVSQDEIHKEPVCFYYEHGVLMRKFRPPESKVDEDWEILHQIVVPQVYRSEVLSIGHDSPMAGHLGVRKTRDRILRHFWWPSVRKDVAQHCRSCHVCQVVGKPNQKIPAAPFQRFRNHFPE